MAGSVALRLDENRFFDADPTVRRIARGLYESVRSLPIVSPHSHVDPALLAKNERLPGPTELILTSDHYIYRMLYSQGIPLEDLGIPALDGTPVERDHRKIWRLFGHHYHLFTGTPTGAWLDHTLHDVFGVHEKLTDESAMRIHDQIEERLGTKEYLPRSLFDRFGIEVLSTTDRATATLEHHAAIRSSGWSGRVIPCFRPDDVIDLLTHGWRERIEMLGRLAGMEIASYGAFIEALERRRTYFRSMGAVATDHGVKAPLTEELSASERESIFERALRGKAAPDDAARFAAHMLMEMARMSTEDGLVMQLHAGSYRNHNRAIFERFGADRGSDIPVRTEFTHNLHALLNRYGNERGFTLIVFTLDESTYSRELAPLAGHYPALRIGPAWWFHDSIEGMMRYREHITETAGIYNTVGFNDDTRALVSIPARHDLCRRIDANFLARSASRHIVDEGEALRLIRALSYDLARRAYNLE